MDDIEGFFSKLLSEIDDLKQRLANTVRHGTVHPGSVDPKAGTVRLRIGGTDDKPLLSPPVRYAQQAGALKIHTPPSDWQQMTLFSPGGNSRLGVAMPFGWSNENKSPSEKGDEHVVTLGDLLIRAKGNEFFVQRGEQQFHFKPDGKVVVKGSEITLDGPVKMPKGFSAGGGEGRAGTINGELHTTKDITSQTRVAAPVIQQTSVGA